MIMSCNRHGFLDVDLAEFRANVRVCPSATEHASLGVWTVVDPITAEGGDQEMLKPVACVVGGMRVRTCGGLTRQAKAN